MALMPARIPKPAVVAPAMVRIFLYVEDFIVSYFLLRKEVYNLLSTTFSEIAIYFYIIYLYFFHRVRDTIMSGQKTWNLV